MVESLVVKELLTSRRILLPGEKWQYRVVFESTTPGDYKHDFVIEIKNSKIIYKVECLGKCNIPKVNSSPEAVFPKIIATRTEKNAFKSCVFVKNCNVFDFGHIFLQKIEEKYAI